MSTTRQPRPDKCIDILVAEDKEEIRELVLVTLEDGPYKVTTVPNGTKALDYARQHHPDILLLDICMPGGIDGLEVCRRIKSNPETSGIRVLILTSKYVENIEPVVSESQADGLVSKPFSPSRLLTIIEDMMAN